jgi:hypothetical protein
VDGCLTGAQVLVGSFQRPGQLIDQLDRLLVKRYISWERAGPMRLVVFLNSFLHADQKRPNVECVPHGNSSPAVHRQAVFMWWIQICLKGAEPVYG